MTRYTVVWHGSAQGELAEIWAIARDRNAVTTATHIHDAATKDVEVSEGLRTFYAPPLRILFTVDEGDRRVEVVRVRRL